MKQRKALIINQKLFFSFSAHCNPVRDYKKKVSFLIRTLEENFEKTNNVHPYVLGSCSENEFRSLNRGELLILPPNPNFNVTIRSFVIDQKATILNTISSSFREVCCGVLLCSLEKVPNNEKL